VVREKICARLGNTVTQRRASLFETSRARFYPQRRPARAD
jgi:hypothetical protein